jgi:hypothetical protein
MRHDQARGLAHRARSAAVGIFAPFWGRIGAQRGPGVCTPDCPCAQPFGLAGVTLWGALVAAPNVSRIHPASTESP